MINFSLHGIIKKLSFQSQEEGLLVYEPCGRKTLIIAGFLLLFISFGTAFIPSNPHPCNVQDESWLPDIFFQLGFGLAGIYLLIEPFIYFVKIEKNGVAVRGTITGTRFSAWEDIYEIKLHEYLEMISIRSRNKEGKKQTLWVSDYTTDLFMLIEKLNAHDLFFEEQKEYIKEAKDYLTNQGYLTATPFKLYLPELAVWRVSDKPNDYIALLLGETEDETALFEHFAFSGELMSLLVEVRNKLSQKTFAFDHEYQEFLIDDLTDIITMYEEQPVQIPAKASLSLLVEN
ncbi:MAG: hypothetical protein ABJN57_14050 [Hyphomicrobiales bacterium]